ncbi:hypothetical protein os1_40430 [Comamonadaceae bacterium OS-1]|nr:hypothetical protein os1_40430 [Comamonadaceae bacterium OS-1]
MLAIGADGNVAAANIAIQAKDVAITEARESSSSSMTTKQSSSGITLALSSPIITAAQTVQGMAQAASQTKDVRMQALAAAGAGLNVYNNVDDIKTAAN